MPGRQICMVGQMGQESNARGAENRRHDLVPHLLGDLNLPGLVARKKHRQVEIARPTPGRFRKTHPAFDVAPRMGPERQIDENADAKGARRYEASRFLRFAIEAM